MRKIIAFILVISVVSLFSLSALAEDSAKLSVSATASVSVTADRAELNIGCVSKDESVTNAQSANASVINKLLASLEAKGILKEDITTAEYSINENYEYEGVTYTKRVLKGYEVTHMLKIIIRDTDKIGEIIDAATAAGANQSNGVSFICSTENEAYEKALTDAVKNARVKADIIAEAAGVTITGIESITESGSSSVYYRNTNYIASSVSMEDSTVISTGSLSVSATVNIVYIIK